jgi:hypothetical protein
MLQEDECNVWAALEESCKELGLSEEDIAEMLRPGGDCSDELLRMIMSKVGSSDIKAIRAVLNEQKVINLTWFYYCMLVSKLFAAAGAQGQ